MTQMAQIKTPICLFYPQMTQMAQIKTPVCLFLSADDADGADKKNALSLLFSPLSLVPLFICSF